MVWDNPVNLHLKSSFDLESSEVEKLDLLSSSLLEHPVPCESECSPPASSGHRYTSIGPLLLFNHICILCVGSGTSNRVSGGALIAITVCLSNDLMLRMS
jgi:hypothetical protein